MQAAQKAARKAIESTYTGVMTVSERQSVKDPNTHITSTKEVVVLENQPCKLSFETIAAIVQTDTAAALSQGVKVFLSPDVSIKAGSKLTVTQNGVTVNLQIKRRSCCIPHPSRNHPHTV